MSGKRERTEIGVKSDTRRDSLSLSNLENSELKMITIIDERGIESEREQENEMKKMDRRTWEEDRLLVHLQTNKRRITKIVPQFRSYMIYGNLPSIRYIFLNGKIEDEKIYMD